MRVLAIETATMLGGIAVMDDACGLIAEVRANVKRAHSERLMAELDGVLRQAGLTLKDIDALCVSAGPGSFTGLRIGISTVKGLSYATGLPVVAVPTLHAFAWTLPGFRFVCPMLDARKKEVYAALFEWRDGGFERVIGEASISPLELAARLSEGAYESVLFTGEGAALYKELLLERLGEVKARFAPAHLSVPAPSAVAFVGLEMAIRGEFSDPAALSPLYIRKSEAEVKLEQRKEP